MSRTGRGMPDAEPKKIVYLFGAEATHAELQASVEPYAIKRRNEFLDGAFEHYLDPRTKGKIIGSE